MKPGNIPTATEENDRLMPYNRSNHFENGDVKVNIPQGALYDTIDFSYKKIQGSNGMLSDLHCIHNIYTPLNKPYTLAIKPDTIPASKKSKMLLIRLDENRKRNAVNSYWSDGYLTAEVGSFGNYYAGIDTVAPEISSNGLSRGVNLTGKNDIRIKIIDDLSGINVYEGSVDGKWALFEYDQKNNVLIYKFDPERLARGTKHTLSLNVSDNKDNTSYFSSSFTW